MKNRLLCATWCYCELIDTLWNVNMQETIDNCGLSYELIDTLWNVNVLNPPAAVFI